MLKSYLINIMMRSLLFLIVLMAFSFSTDLLAQDNYGIKFPGNNRGQVCQYFQQIFRQKPKEVSFSIKRSGDDLFFVVNDRRWFKQLFKDRYDGIAIDIVKKSRFDCAKENIENKQIRGKLLPPVYRNALRRELKPAGDQLYRTYVGKIPTGIKSKTLEYNILFLKDKNLCRYQIMYNLESYPWELLDMGMYLDSLTYQHKPIKPEAKNGVITKTKSMKFVVPFEKNKAEYTQEDIKPIYDSLRLTNFNIQKIAIKAYSSVEGSLERNIELQEQRANSIIKALQSFQKPTIETTVSTAENWVEFLNDIENTQFENLQSLTKSQIKAKLTGEIANQLEPILKDHRKAVLRLELEKKDTYKSLSATELINKYDTAVGEADIDKAAKIQNSIFDKIRSNTVSPEYLKKLQVPKQAKFARLINKNSAFKYLNNKRQALIVYKELKELEKLVPKDKKVKYNITTLKIKLWRYQAIPIDKKQLKQSIINLKKFGIAQPLIKRMLVNYHIIKAEKSMRKRDYQSKDASVKYINKTYEKFDLSDFDYLSLAQFFSYYANTKLAVELLENKVRSIDIDEDLLFYYLNLTLINKELTKDSDYRTALLNAYNMNENRFCNLFNSVDNGGVSFQLLANNYLRKTYCENCQP